MKTLMLLLFAAAASAQIPVGAVEPVSQSKGNITVAVTGTDLTTTFTITSVDPKYAHVISVWYANSDSEIHPRVITVLPWKNSKESVATIAVPIGQILWYSITEVLPGQTQFFSK